MNPSESLHLFHESIQLYFTLSSALQSYWTLYVAVIVALLGFSSQRKQPDLLTTVVVTALYGVFAYQNLSAILDVSAQRRAALQVVSENFGSIPAFAALAPTLHPASPASTLGFHLVGDLLTIAALWVMERRRNHDAAMRNVQTSPGLDLTSMKTLALIILLAVLWLPITGRAQQSTATPVASDVPEIVSKGFQAYQKNGPLAAVTAWLAGSAIATDDNMQDQVTGRMNRIQGVFGRMTGYEVLRVVPLTASTRRVYAAMKFEKGVAWMFFDCYQPGGGWIITTLDFYTKANLILPPNLLGGQ